MNRMGFLIVAIEGLKLSKKEQELLKHPAVAGVILFAHNYKNKSQITKLTKTLHEIKPGFIVSVDHECGRVQRFNKDFTKLPIPGEIGRYYDKDKEAALEVAYAYGVIVGSEMREVNVDLSYTPVLDIANNKEIIGDRAFHQHPEVVVELAQAMISGLHNSSLPACGKHFPGHGSVVGDTHTDVIRDSRLMSEIEAQDMYPFSTLIKSKQIDAIMLSHIIYEAASDAPASLSEYWIKTVLREQLAFEGIICTDDINMAGSGDVDSTVLKRTMDAGCDLLLICDYSISPVQRLLATFSDAEIEHYSRQTSQHLDAIDSHIHNRISNDTRHYADAVSTIEHFNRNQ